MNAVDVGQVAGWEVAVDGEFLVGEGSAIMGFGVDSRRGSVAVGGVRVVVHQLNINNYIY